MSGSTGSYFPRWQLAALIGAPIALGIGYLYYRQMSSAKPSAGGGSGLDKKKIDSLDKAVSIDKDDQPMSEKFELTGLEKAQKHKSDGNKLFHKGEYDKAIDAYDLAINECPKENNIDLATFYQNRAAAFEQLGQWRNVIEDCSKAFELNTKYIKALQRRAKAYEKLDKYEESLEDITAVCILQRFSNSASLVHADRVLRAVGQKNAKELMKNRKPVQPSKHFVKNYFSSFINDPIVNMSVSSENPTGFVKAKLAFDHQDYENIVANCTKEIEAAEANSEYKQHALLLRATFYILTGQLKEAEEDLERLLAGNLDKKLHVNALIKMSSLYMQTDRAMQCFVSFTKAEEVDPNNADLYHHRGQVYTLLDQLDNALKDFRRAVELSPDHGITYVHKCYAEYRMAVTEQNQFKLNSVMEEFSAAIDKFPDCVECYSITAQILSDQSRFGPADEFFAKASKIDPQNATILVHRGLLQLQWNANIDEALRLINQAIKIDDKCEFAYETLGTIEVQRGRLDAAVDLFDKAMALAKSEVELTHLSSLKDAAVAQLNVAKKFGIDIQSMAALGRTASDAFMPA